MGRTPSTTHRWLFCRALHLTPSDKKFGSAANIGCVCPFCQIIGCGANWDCVPSDKKLFLATSRNLRHIPKAQTIQVCTSVYYTWVVSFAMHHISRLLLRISVVLPCMWLLLKVLRLFIRECKEFREFREISALIDTISLSTP